VRPEIRFGTQREGHPQKSMPGPTTNTEQVYPYALTTLARVKARLQFTTADWDPVLIRWINSATDFIQTATGGRQFVETAYVNDTYSPRPGDRFLVLRQTPVLSLESFQWRAGPPSVPQWTDFITDQFELINPRPRPIPGETDALWYPDGMIRIYGVLPSLYSNSVRASYIAGYPIDWPNAGNGTTHLLPSDLSDVCENLVVRRYKRRDLAGKSSEGIDSASTNWRDNLDSDDREVIDRYTMVPIFV